jgi:hypothetical protein
MRGETPSSGGYAMQCAGAIQGKEGGTQVLASLAPSSQTVGSIMRVIYEQGKRSSGTTEANIALVARQQSWVNLLPPSCQGRAAGRVEAPWQVAPNRGRPA